MMMMMVEGILTAGLWARFAISAAWCFIAMAAVVMVEGVLDYSWSGTMIHH